MKTKVLFITHDKLGPNMAGPAIRCWELSRVLARTCDVRITSIHPVELSHPDFQIVSFDHDAKTLLRQAAESDVLIVQGVSLSTFPELAKLGKYVVADVYDPFVFESYEFFETLGEQRDAVFCQYVDVMNNQLCLADYFVCANERQRDLWLGNLAGLARLSPQLLGEDRSASRVIGLVPFGISDGSPIPKGHGIRGQVPGIRTDDFILLWGGGIYSWFDPITIIRAVAELGKTRGDIKLYFMGIKHPNPDVPEMAMTAQAIALAEELGIKDRLVYFNTEWVPYEERQGLLCDVDAGVSAHFDSIETRFSFRTRVLDYLWAGLPILTTQGDAFAELVAREGLGTVLGYEDVEGWARAIAELADRPDRQDLKERVRRASQTFRWTEVAKPLEAYCQAPYRTPRLFDRLYLSHQWNHQLLGIGRNPPVPKLTAPGKIVIGPGFRGLLDLARKAIRVLRRDGSVVLVKKSVRALLTR